jgi:hypothetical protein
MHGVGIVATIRINIGFPMVVYCGSSGAAVIRFMMCIRRINREMQHLGQNQRYDHNKYRKTRHHDQGLSHTLLRAWAVLTRLARAGA